MRRPILRKVPLRLRWGVVHPRTWIALVFATAECRAQKGQEDVAPASNGRSEPIAAAAAPRNLRVAAATPVGEVAPIVRDAVAKAAADKRHLVVYVGAEWCEPCRRFLAAAEHGELDAEFGDVTLLEFDLDRDEARLRPAGYVSQYVPLFALPAADGASSGKQIEGAIKGDGAIAFIEPRLRRLLSR